MVADSIRLVDRFACFDNTPTNANTTYSVKICADIPVNSIPTALITLGFQPEPGHAFLELTKTNGTNSVTQTIGFYPESYKKAAGQTPVASMVVDNRGHEYDASLLKMLNAQQFSSMLSAATAAAGHKYQMTGYNCTQFALDVYNSQGTTLSIADTSPMPGVNYGKTPNGLYLDIKNKYNNLFPGASPFSGTGAASTNCSN